MSLALLVVYGASAGAAFSETPSAGQRFQLVTGTSLGSPKAIKPLVAAPAVDGESVVTGSTRATLYAQINPNEEVTSFTFEYSKSAKGETLEAPVIQVAGSEPLPAESGDLTASSETGALEPSTRYFYRVVASNGTGPAAPAPVQSFVTLPTPSTDAVEAIGATTATFHGHFTLDATATQYSFVYNLGKECSGGSSTPVQEAGMGSAPISEMALVGELQPSHEYTVCFVTSNAFGSQQGPPVHFSTLGAPPVIDKEGTSAVSSTGATLDAAINPDNQMTSYRFEYADNATLTGATVLPGASTLTAEFGDQTASVSTSAPLAAGTTYYYRVIAENGTAPASIGAVASFTTTPVPHTDPATDVGAVTATVDGHFTLSPTSVEAQFLYKAGSECTGGFVAGSKAYAAGTSEATLTATLTGLRPGTKYTVCLTTQDYLPGQAGVVIEQGLPVSFETLPAAVEGESVSTVSDTNATLGAELVSGGSEASYHFEYDTTPYTTPAASGTDVPVPDATVPASDQDASVSEVLRGLEPGVTYYYRLVGKTSEAGTFTGPDQSFTTESYASATLPDGRAYELVSPAANQYGAEPAEINQKGISQAAENGDAIAYGSRLPSEQNPPSNSTRSTELLSTRGPSGWTTRDLGAPIREYGGPNDALGEVEVFSPDLSKWIVRPGHFNAGQSEVIRELSSEAPEGIEQLPFLVSSSGFEPLVTQAESGPMPGGRVELEAMTNDLSHVVVGLSENAGGHLSPLSLYESSAGTLKQVNVLPDGQAVYGSVGNSERYEYVPFTNNARHAISEDGSHVIWSTLADEIFDRSTVAEETTVVGQGTYLTASSDGSTVLYVEGTSQYAPGDLHAYDLTSQSNVDLTPNGLVDGMLGASADASTFYFVAESVLAPGATAGQPNAYWIHREGSSWTKPRFIATLQASDSRDWAPDLSGGRSNQRLYEQTAEASTNGQYLAFMSQAQLTDYDNFGENEVYVFDTASNQVVCPSCTPTGARPEGESSIPSWILYGGEEQTSYQPHFLSNQGRLFFDSDNALVPQDTNAKQDVYEYEPAGVGSCREAPGCVALISGGTGAAGSSFLDASTSGEDAFFITGEQLVPSDQDETKDVYDAHVCTSAAPCTVSPASPVPCTSSDACKPSPSPQPAVFGPPPSATFSGAGNLAPSGVARVAKAKAKPLTRKQKLARALEQCKRLRKRQRSACEARARKRFGSHVKPAIPGGK
jgi:phosphodiesterase/alkaline phosphatase D-like protein